MLIVASGARRDLGQAEAAVQVLEGAHLRSDSRQPSAARLFYAYAEALLAAERLEEGAAWFAHAAAADEGAATDAAERVAALGGVTFLETEADDVS